MPGRAPFPKYVVALVLLALVATGCGGGSGESGANTDEDDAAGAQAGPKDPFPVTIDHVWGSTTIDEDPERVVTLGLTDVDVALALGVTPVATSGYTFFDDGLGPWAAPLVEGEQPEFLTGEMNIEHIAALQPDLIIAVTAGIEESDYDQLSNIAPTVARPDGTEAYQVPREDATQTIGLALGRSERGEELIEEATAHYQEAIADHSQFEGKTGVVVLPYDGKYGAYTSRDARGQFMTQLGFDLPPALEELDTEGEFSIEISRERVALLDADVMVMLADDPDDPDARAFVDDDVLLQNLPVAADGRMIVPDTDLRGAITYNTVLSVPYALEGLVPQLAAALGDD